MPRPLIPDIVHDQVLITSREHDNVQSAVDLMIAHHIGAVLIISPNGGLVGIFTERDLMTRIVGPGRVPSKTPLDAVMTRNPDMLAPKSGAREALRLMHDGNYRHLPILDCGRLVGIVSMRDLYTAIVGALEDDLVELALCLTRG